MTGPIASVSEKIGSRHRDRMAIVYIRQSTLRQVDRHQESTRLQTGLVERATRTNSGDFTDVELELGYDEQ